jgi:hypothetical protein
MRRFRIPIALGALAACALVATVVVLASGGGGRADLAPRSGDLKALRTTDLFHLRTTWSFDGGGGSYDEWFSPGSGLFSTKLPSDDDKTFALSNDGRRAYIWDQSLRRVEGTREFLKALSAPTVDVRPGASLLYAYLAGGDMKSRIEDGRLVILDDSWQPQENNDEKVKFATTVEARISEHTALDRHLFATPKTNDLRRLREPGQPASLAGLHAWWLGPVFHDERAVTAWEDRTAKPDHGDGKAQYTTIYAGKEGASSSLSPQDPLEWPEWPGRGYLNPDVILVESMPLATAVGYDNEPEHDEPITLGDGSKGTLITIGQLQWIRTRDALIKLGVRYESGLGSLAPYLVPVPR